MEYPLFIIISGNGCLHSLIHPSFVIHQLRCHWPEGLGIFSFLVISRPFQSLLFVFPLILVFTQGRVILFLCLTFPCFIIPELIYNIMFRYMLPGMQKLVYQTICLWSICPFHDMIYNLTVISCNIYNSIFAVFPLHVLRISWTDILLASFLLPLVSLSQHISPVSCGRNTCTFNGAKRRYLLLK